MVPDSHTPLVGPYVLPPLPYDYAALEPTVDEATMRLHHDKHHQAYIDALNKALATHPEWLGKSIEAVLADLDKVPEDIRQAVRNQGGGHANHQLFWKLMTPNAPAAPSGELAAAIDRDFGSLDAFKTQFIEAGTKQFGSGWVFLVADPMNGFKLRIVTTPNQDSVITLGLPALLACDIWEHAYYLRYNNRRADWLKSWWDVVNWIYVEERLQGIHAGQTPF